MKGWGSQNFGICLYVTLAVHKKILKILLTSEAPYSQTLLVFHRYLQCDDRKSETAFKQKLSNVFSLGCVCHLANLCVSSGSLLMLIISLWTCIVKTMRRIARIPRVC